MDFSLSPDQQLLKESAERFVARDYPFTARRAAAASDDGFSRDVWARFAELGWLGSALPEAYGGYGGGAVDTMVLMEALGRGLVVEPVVPVAVLAGGLVALAGDEAQKAALLPPLAAGRLIAAAAHGEPQARYDLEDVALAARGDGGGFVLDGVKSVVFAGGAADVFVVSARTAGGRRDRHGVSLFVVERGADGLGVRDYPTVDGLRAAELAFDGVRVGADARLGPADGALPLIERAVDVTTAAVCAEALGIMAALNDATLDYLKTRVQFDQPIGRFQALQHRMVDMFVACEETRSLVAVAAIRADADDARERARAVSAAKVQVGRAGRLIAHEAVQLHGAIAMTDDFWVGHYVKRLRMIDRQFGDADHHLARFAAL